MIVELKKKCTVPGLANRPSLFEQVSKHLIRYIDWPKFEHCLSAKLVHGPKLITKKVYGKILLKSLCQEIHGLLCACSNYGCQQVHGTSVCKQASV